MQIKKIAIKNFRLLKDVTIDLEEDLSLIIGKNNCGKTSLLLILDKFIGSGSSKNIFTFDDFNVDFKDQLKSKIEGNHTSMQDSPFSSGISLKLFIEYDESDDLSNIGNKVIMDLDPENKVVVLAFEYYLSEDKFEALRKDYKAHVDKRTADGKTPKCIFSFLKEQHTNYFQITKKSLQYDMGLQREDDDVFTDLKKENIPIDKIINFKLISARRSVSNKDSEKALSSLSSKIYKRIETNNNPAVIEKFKDALSDTDKQLDGIYADLFQEVINDVKKFGGIRNDDSIIKIVSSLQHRELLEENTTVVYGLGSPEHTLPENYNGLGYMNLISMIFEIKILLHEFQKEKEEKPSDINLLFIEEPEAHTHPQMQHIFIKNIKLLLKSGVEREDGKTRKLQTILTTHSSHIVSESDFEDIKYFKRDNAGIVSKNLKDLESQYGAANPCYKFLKQYLTLHRSELFFADKAIFIEGDTERILLPAMMKKLDQEDMQREFQEGWNPTLPLLSQNVSVIEVGAYSHVFEQFLDFIGIKSLIITDIDSGNDTTGKCLVSEGTKINNSSLKFFYDSDSLADFVDMPLNQKILKKNYAAKKWENNSEGHLICVYQTKETNGDDKKYHARSFEDSFFHINHKFIAENTFDEQGEFIGNERFPILTQGRMQKFARSEIDAWEMANAVVKKPSFAMEILLNSVSDEIELRQKNTGEKRLMIKEFSNWNTPAYIEEGLQWLKRD